MAEAGSDQQNTSDKSHKTAIRQTLRAVEEQVKDFKRKVSVQQEIFDDLTDDLETAQNSVNAHYHDMEAMFSKGAELTADCSLKSGLLHETQSQLEAERKLLRQTQATRDKLISDIEKLEAEEKSAESIDRQVRSERRTLNARLSKCHAKASQLRAQDSSVMQQRTELAESLTETRRKIAQLESELVEMKATKQKVAYMQSAWRPQGN
eukprot:44002_1